MKIEVFQSVVQVKPELESGFVSLNIPQELVIISPHPLSDTTLLLFSHEKLLSALKQDEGLSAVYKFLNEENDSINHVRLEMGILKFNILKKNELLYDLTPNINVLDLIEEVRLFAPSTQPREGILTYGIEFSFRNVVCAEARDHVDDSRVYGVVAYHPESETLDIHCNDFIDNDFSEFDQFKDLIKAYATAFFNHPTIPFSQMLTMRLDLFSYPAQNPDYLAELISELEKHYKSA
ncbi:hypothetical protein V6380_15475 [Acinetobacter variabilis]|uniref:hypothetical protein n=1 Tax=Acinetobacter variabilis TaxID=70346 RepID=UPI003B83C4FC